jgi:hypothetical protein
MISVDTFRGVFAPLGHWTIFGLTVGDKFQRSCAVVVLHAARHQTVNNNALKIGSVLALFISWKKSEKKDGAY